MSEHYSMVIEWSDEDQAYVVSLPEWGPWVKTHGTTREEALRNAQDLLDTLLEHVAHGELEAPVPRIRAHAH